MNTNLSANASMIAMGARMSANERNQGRFLRDEGGHEQNNAPVNPEPKANNESSSNNTGQEFDASTFWEDQEGGTGDSGTPKPKETPSGESGGNEQFGTQLSERIKGFAAGDVFDADVVEGINEGDFSKFNTNLNGAIQKSMEQNTEMTVSILQKFGERMMSHIEGKLNSQLDSRENYATLETEIPSSKNAAVAPIVRSIYDRALTLTKGDKGKAITMTKSMLASMAQETGSDSGMNVAPVGSDSNFGNSGPKTNWLEELNKA